MQRTAISWLLVFGLLAAGFGATVLALNNDLFSAHGFVRSYLQALERRDADEALGFDGVDVPAGESTALLVDDALGGLDGIRFISDVEADGVHVVRFATALEGGETISEFRVESAGTRLGLFGAWRFAQSPLSRLAVTVDTDTRFTANGVDAVAGQPALVLAPGDYELDHESEYLTATAVTVPVGEIGATVAASLTVTATSKFEDAATTAVASFLDDCATQEVLMPTACPFGFREANRLQGPPSWSIDDYPTVTLSPSGTPGIWTATGRDAAAHITAKVRSLFDGSLSTLDERVPFAATYLVTVGADDELSVTASP